MGKITKSDVDSLAMSKVNPFFWRTGVNPIKLNILDRWMAGMRAVDIGCGNGAYAQYLRKEGFSVTAIDNKDQVIEKEGIDFLLTNVPPIPLTDKFCDTLILFDVLEHVKMEDKLLAEVKRVTKKG